MAAGAGPSARTGAQRPPAWEWKVTLEKIEDEFGAADEDLAGHLKMLRDQFGRMLQTNANALDNMENNYKAVETKRRQDAAAFDKVKGKLLEDVKDRDDRIAAHKSLLEAKAAELRELGALTAELEARVAELEQEARTWREKYEGAAARHKKEVAMLAAMSVGAGKTPLPTKALFPGKAPAASNAPRAGKAPAAGNSRAAGKRPQAEAAEANLQGDSSSEEEDSPRTPPRAAAGKRARRRAIAQDSSDLEEVDEEHAKENAPVGPRGNGAPGAGRVTRNQAQASFVGKLPRATSPRSPRGFGLRTMYTREEKIALVKGCVKYKGCQNKWRDILVDPEFTAFHPSRTAVKLKDLARTLISTVYGDDKEAIYEDKGAKKLIEAMDADPQSPSKHQSPSKQGTPSRSQSKAPSASAGKAPRLRMGA